MYVTIWLWKIAEIFICNLLISIYLCQQSEQIQKFSRIKSFLIKWWMKISAKKSRKFNIAEAEEYVNTLYTLYLKKKRH